MASVAATSTLAPALAARRRARPGTTGLLTPPRRASAVRCSLDSNVSDMAVNGEERDPITLDWSVGYRTGSLPPLLGDCGDGS